MEVAMLGAVYVHVTAVVRFRRVTAPSRSTTAGGMAAKHQTVNVQTTALGPLQAVRDTKRGTSATTSSFHAPQVAWGVGLEDVTVVRFAKESGFVLLMEKLLIVHTAQMTMHSGTEPTGTLYTSTSVACGMWVSVAAGQLTVEPSLMAVTITTGMDRTIGSDGVRTTRQAVVPALDHLVHALAVVDGVSAANTVTR